MGTKPILLSFENTGFSNAKDDWQLFNNRFTGEWLFRNNFYHIVTGNLSVLNNTGNKWLYEEILKYSERTLDVNLLPALKKIASDTRSGESLQQKATEMIELTEANKNRQKNGFITFADNKEARAENARVVLAGVRYPQTTEILRLIRDNSVELKQIALCLIGRFRITDMTSEVCECLDIPELESDAVSVITDLGSPAIRDINRFYLASSGNLNISKTILRLYTVLCPKDSMSFLIERMATSSRQIREIAVRSLLMCGFTPDAAGKEILRKQAFETFGLLSWIISVRVCLHDNKSKSLLRHVEREYKRWRSYLLSLLVLTYGKSISVTMEAEKSSGDESGEIYDLAEIFSEGSSLSSLKNLPDVETDRKKLKKLFRYFPGAIPAYDQLPEEILNCDYNLVSVLTKASAIREINDLKNENIRESVAAVLFSPERILKEEAARLAGGFDTELFGSVENRLPENDKKHLEIVMGKEYDEHDLLYEKSDFLSRLFSDFNDEELLFLAGKMIYNDNKDPEFLTQIENSVVWETAGEKPSFRASVIHEKPDGAVFKTGSGVSDSFLYVLRLESVEQFSHYYPESSYTLLKYIDGVEG